ncbi:MAG: hypothetical protein J6X31_03415 [Bacteroidales bacterium]|nr:hypothetical protein [Bacteroidales bacterium]MBP5680073.1 hypothetical protein [Bacteroidales bacterium]
MKTYIAPEIIEVEVNTEDLLLDSSPILSATEAGEGDVTTEDGFAAGSYRSSLWSD